MQLETKAMEESARAIYETYFGKGTWGDAGADQRGQARQAVRLVLGVLTKNAVELPVSASKPGVGGPSPKPAAGDKTTPPVPATQAAAPTSSARAPAPTAPGRRPGAARPPSPTLRR